MNVPDVTYLERTIGFLYTGLYRVKNGNRQGCAFTAQTVEKRGGSRHPAHSAAFNWPEAVKVRPRLNRYKKTPPSGFPEGEKASDMGEGA